MGIKPCEVKIFQSWDYIHPDFADDLKSLRQSEQLHRNSIHPVIWRTKQKFVMRVETPSGKVAAFKIYDQLKTPRKFFMRHSPAAAEALNYQRIADLNIAVPQLLAAGDVRCRGQLKNSFIVTEFAEGFSDGRDFFGDGVHAGNVVLRDEFIRRAMMLLARCHDHRILHRGYTPANILSRVRESADADGNNLDIMFIDVASCRKLPCWLLKLKLMVDFIMFFRFFDLNAARRKDFLQHYINAAEKPLFKLDILTEKVEKALRKHLKKK